MHFVVERALVTAGLLAFTITVCNQLMSSDLHTNFIGFSKPSNSSILSAMESLYPRGANATPWTGDDTFGPQGGTLFDFTLFFEHTILTILPASLFLFVCPLYLARFLRKPVCFKHGLLLWTKLVGLRRFPANNSS